VLEGELATGLGEVMGIEAGSVIGHDAAHRDAEPGKVSYGLMQETDRGSSFLVRQHSSEGNAGVVVDGDVEKLPTGAAGFISGIAGDAVARLDNAGQLLDVEMQQIAGGSMFVTHDGYLGLQHFDLVELQSGQNAAHRGPAQPSGLGDANSGPALPTQPFYPLDQSQVHPARRAMGTRGAVAQRRAAGFPEAAYPLGRTLPAELELGRGLLQAQSAFHNTFCKSLSTVNRQSSMMVVVHSVSCDRFCSQLQHHSSRSNGQQPIETSQLKPRFWVRFAGTAEAVPFQNVFMKYALATALPMPPDLIRDHVVFAVAHWLVPVDGDFAGNRLDDAGQRLPNVGIAVRLHGRGVHGVEEAIAHLLHEDLSLTRRALLRFVAEVDPQRREENEGEDDRDHYVVRNAAARICPPDVAFDGLGDFAHRQSYAFAIIAKAPVSVSRPYAIFNSSNSRSRCFWMSFLVKRSR